MKIVKSLVVLVILGLFQTASAADCTVTLSWDGLQANGTAEQSLPVTFEVYDADTMDVLSTAQVNGAVTDYAMPSFSVNVPDNQTITLRVQATATDSAGNRSAPSEVATATLTGADTSAPMQPQINITITE